MSGKMNRSAAAALIAAMAASVVLSGCSKISEIAGSFTKEEELPPVVAFEKIPDNATIDALGLNEPEEPEVVEEHYELPEGMYFSELTGEPISEDIQNQRPVAFMIDNDERAMPHFGLADADVIYELMNSTANDRITRLMCLYKDWGTIEKVGSIRSVRPTNIILASEWNAVLCHDGGPVYIDEYFAKGYMQHFSGTFSRVDNGKDREFTEFCLAGDLDSNFDSAGVSREYDEYKPDDDTHFNFAEYETEITLDDAEDSMPASEIDLPFANTGSKLIYNEDTQTYDYYEHGDYCLDGGDDRQVTFENVLVQSCSFHEYDEHGYMIYNVIQSDQPGYYLTKGEAIPITWTKESENGLTRYYNADGEEITLNTGKTYITLIPDDTWDQVEIKS